MSIRCMTRITLGLLSKSVIPQLKLNSAKTLYTKASMGLTDYEASRVVFDQKYNNSTDVFRSKMQAVIQDEQGLIFTEDLKAMLHMVQKNPEDIELLRAMLIKHHNQTNVRFGNYCFGPVVMRTFYFLNEPTVALDIFKDPSLEKFFNQITTYMVLLDLLYENKMYEEVKKTYSYILANHMTNSAHPKLGMPILAMACYKLNTPESLKYIYNICEELQKKGRTPLRRVLSIAAALALKQKNPQMALDICSWCQTPEYVVVRSIRVMAFADLDRLDDVLLNLRMLLGRGFPERNNFYADVAIKLEEAMERNKVPEDAEVRRSLNELKNQGYVMDTTLDEALSKPIDYKKSDDHLSRGNDNRNMRKRREYKDAGWSQQGQNEFARRTNNNSDYDEGRSRFGSV